MEGNPKAHRSSRHTTAKQPARELPPDRAFVLQLDVARPTAAPRGSASRARDLWERGAHHVIARTAGVPGKGTAQPRQRSCSIGNLTTVSIERKGRRPWPSETRAVLVRSQ